jgi:hypothetical protein
MILNLLFEDMTFSSVRLEASEAEAEKVARAYIMAEAKPVLDYDIEEA